MEENWKGVVMKLIILLLVCSIAMGMPVPSPTEETDTTIVESGGAERITGGNEMYQVFKDGSDRGWTVSNENVRDMLIIVVVLGGIGLLCQ